MPRWNIASEVPLVALRLLLCRQGHSVLNVQRIWAAVLGMAILFAASTVWTEPSTTQQVVSPPRLTVPTTAVLDNAARELPADDETWAEPRVDLNGNEIDEAVGDYRVDSRGEMYERHAPDTALLHLSAPEL